MCRIRDVVVDVTRELRKGRLAKRRSTAISAVYQKRYTDDSGCAIMWYRPRAPEMRATAPRMRRMARRNFRGVGMKGTGATTATRVVVRLKASVVME